MKLSLESKIRLECNNWYETEHNLLKVCLRNGQTILLTSNYKTIWLAIGFGTTLSELLATIDNKIPLENVINILIQLSQMDLLRIMKPEDEFNIIFD